MEMDHPIDDEGNLDQFEQEKLDRMLDHIFGDHVPTLRTLIQ
jgi:hypothetical protein